MKGVGCKCDVLNLSFQNQYAVSLYVRDITCVWKCRKVISCVVVDLAGGQTISPQFYDEL